MSTLTHGSSWGEVGGSPDRRVTPDRRIEQSIHCQEALARYVAETRGQDSHAGKALKEFEQRRAAATDLARGDDELIIHSLRGQWVVGTVHEIREAMRVAAAAACRRRRTPMPAASMEPTPHH